MGPISLNQMVSTDNLYPAHVLNVLSTYRSDVTSVNQADLNQQQWRKNDQRFV